MDAQKKVADTQKRVAEMRNDTQRKVAEMRNELQPGLQKMRGLATDAKKKISTVADMDLGEATGRGIKKATKGIQQASEGMQKEFKGVATKISVLGNSIKGKAQELLQESMVVGRYTVRVQHLLAEGGFSEVFLVKDGMSGKAMALKRVLCRTDEAEKDALAEIRVHKSVDHPNVLKLIDHATGYFAKGRSVKEVLLLFPLCERGSVWDAVEGI